MSEKLALLQQLKNEKCIGVIIRADDGSVDLHFNKLVVQIKSLDHLYISPIISKVK